MKNNKYIRTKQRKLPDYFKNNYKNVNYLCLNDYDNDVLNNVIFYEKYGFIKQCSKDCLKNIKEYADKISYWNLYDFVDGIINIYKGKFNEYDKIFFLQKILNTLNYKNKSIDQIVTMFEDSILIEHINNIYLYPKRLLNHKTEYKLCFKDYILIKNRELCNIDHFKYFPHCILTKNCKIHIPNEYKKDNDYCDKRIQKNKRTFMLENNKNNNGIINFLVNSKQYITKYNNLYKKFNENVITIDSVDDIITYFKKNNIYYNYIQLVSINEQNEYKLMSKEDICSRVNENKNKCYSIKETYRREIDKYTIVFKNITF